LLLLSTHDPWTVLSPGCATAARHPMSASSTIEPLAQYLGCAALWLFNRAPEPLETKAAELA
jgi:hypothetical protein